MVNKIFQSVLPRFFRNFFHIEFERETLPDEFDGRRSRIHANSSERIVQREYFSPYCFFRFCVLEAERIILRDIRMNREHSAVCDQDCRGPFQNRDGEGRSIDG